MIRFLASGIATVDKLREVMELREAVLAKIARARYVRDITVEAKQVVDTVIKLKRIKDSIHVG